jgi:hypothetical protein
MSESYEQGKREDPLPPLPPTPRTEVCYGAAQGAPCSAVVQLWTPRLIKGKRCGESAAP